MMARYIHCENCKNRMEMNANKFGEHYESLEGTALDDMFCDGGCCTEDGPTPIKKGEKCFAALLLPNTYHPNYPKHKPENWALGLIKPVNP